MPVITIADVDTLLAGELGQWLQAQTSAREEAKRKAAKRMVGGLVLGAPFLLGFFWDGGWGQAVGFVGLAIIAIGFTMGGIIRQNMVSSLKREINSALARSLGVEYSPEAAFGDEFNLAYAYDLLPGYTRKTCEDCWQGEINEFMKDDSSFDDDLVDQLTRDCFNSKDYQEGQEAFMNKRPPVFHGK